MPTIEDRLRLIGHVRSACQDIMNTTAFSDPLQRREFRARYSKQHEAFREEARALCTLDDETVYESERDAIHQRLEDLRALVRDELADQEAKTYPPVGTRIEIFERRCCIMIF